MIKGITKTGFKFEIDDTIVDDWDFLECLSEATDNPLMFVTFAKKLLGNEQYIQLKKHLKQKNEVVKITDMTATILEILNSANETKN